VDIGSFTGHEPVPSRRSYRERHPLEVVAWPGDPDGHDVRVRITVVIGDRQTSHVGSRLSITMARERLIGPAHLVDAIAVEVPCIGLDGPVLTGRQRCC